jgi:hypothetical protein
VATVVDDLEPPLPVVAAAAGRVVTGVWAVVGVLADSVVTDGWAMMVADEAGDGCLAWSLVRGTGAGNAVTVALPSNDGGA